ncbi:MAG: hypothetical protein R3F19_15355 [Verrucomicrobiales bacterium]
MVEDGEVMWHFTPIEQIPMITEDSRGWFRETHPNIANRYVAFQDYGNGDTSGYLFDKHLKSVIGIYIFEHESYEFDEDQNWEEFVRETDSAIEGYLSSLC